jgi:PadR family transcriptional regulator PadR
VSGITRVTGPLLDVLEYFLDAYRRGDQEVHGWAIMHAVKRSGPTVYGVLDRLEDAVWITGRWEENPEGGRPRRRLYRLTPNGRIEALQLLAERRPSAAPGTGKPGFVQFGWREHRLDDGPAGAGS